MGYRVGIVSELDAESCRVRVSFGADDGVVSWWLPVLQPRTSGDSAYWMPGADEQVVCLLDEHAEDGVVLGSVYSSEAPPPHASLDVVHLQMRDGTVIEYDTAAHRLTVSLAGAGAEIALSAPGGVRIEVPAGQHVLVGGPGGEELVTRSFLEQSYGGYLAHTHLAGAPGSPTSPPVQRPPCKPGVDLTAKLKAE